MSPETHIEGQLGQFGAWHGIAVDVLGPKHSLDELEVNEMATCIYGFCQCLKQEFKVISRICDKNEDRMIKVSGSFQLDRRTTPRETSVDFRYAEKHGSGVKLRVPDPGQTELPFDAPAKSTQPEILDKGAEESPQSAEGE